MEDPHDQEKTNTSEAFNPQLPTELTDGDVEKIRGDAIGNTLFSERFVLTTLLKLTKLEVDLAEDEEFEKELCNLWDMTIESDVVELLLDHSVLELFSSVIQTTEDLRKLEILIGIIGNMCNVKKTRDTLCSQPEITYPIIATIACCDPLTLIQLMRFFHSVLVFENLADEILWFQHFEQIDDFVEKFAFILSNSCNLSLLLNGFEALNAICTKFSILEIQPDLDGGDKCFRNMFVKPLLITALNDAFNQLLFPESADQDEGATDVEKIVSKKRTRIMNLFLDIHVILSQFENYSMAQYRDQMPEVLNCIAKILLPFCSEINLLPMTTNEQGIIENVNEIFSALKDPFNPDCFTRMCSIWFIMDKHCTANAAKASEWEDDEPSEDVNTEDILLTTLEFITRTSTSVSDEEFETAVKELEVNLVIRLYTVLTDEGEIDACSDKFKAALKKIWKVEVGGHSNGDGTDDDEGED